jgi:streptogramin lyase
MSRKSSWSTAHEASSGLPASAWGSHGLLTLMAPVALLLTLAVSLVACDSDVSTVRFPTLTRTPVPVITEFAVPTRGSQPFAITSGPDGNLWFTELLGHKIGRVTAVGAITDFPC